VDVENDLQDARRALVDVLEGMSQEEMAVRYAFPWSAEGSPSEWVTILVRHDLEHSLDVRSALGEK
jgi:hypothetical protein